MPNSDAGQNESGSSADPHGVFRRQPTQPYGSAAPSPPLPQGPAQFGAAPGAPQTDPRSGFYRPQAPVNGTGYARGVAPAPMIPLRAMTVPELFSGTAKIMVRHWPALLGIPVAILVGFALFVFASAETIGTVMVKASMSLGAGGLDSLSSLMTGMLVVWVVYFVVVAAIALPADALLIALSVIATDSAVRGRPIQPREVLGQARRRMFAVCRLTLVFYAILFLPQVVFYLMLTSSPKMMIALAGPGGLVLTFLVMFPIYFGLGLVLSLAPIAVVIEGRGVGAALRRSVQLLKPAFWRILGIHVLWSVCMLLVLWAYFALLGEQMLTNLIDSPLSAAGDLLLFAGVVGVMIGFFRVLQALIYTDVRIRQEGYDHELIADWNRAAAAGVATGSVATGKALLVAGIGIAVVVAMSVAVSAFSGPSDDDVVQALKRSDTAGIFKNGRPLFHVTDIDEAGAGWYVARIKRDDVQLETGTVILQRGSEGRLTVFMGPGTAFPCKSLVKSVAKQVICFDGN
ncbi:hypothetical protein [Mycobacterium sp. HM-7]